MVTRHQTKRDTEVRELAEDFDQKDELRRSVEEVRRRFERILDLRRDKTEKAA